MSHGDHDLRRIMTLHSRPERWFVFSVSFFLLSSQLLTFLLFNEYSLFAKESFFLFGLLAIFCLAAEGLSWRWGMIGFFVTGFSLLLLIDTAIPEYSKIKIPGATSVIAHSLKDILALVILATFLRFLGSNGWKILAVMAGAALLASTTTGRRFDAGLHITRDIGLSAEYNADLPPVLYIILDEHIGLGYIPSGVSTAPAAVEKMHAFYVGYRFLLFENAFSRYFDTHRSIPTALNFIPEFDKEIFLRELGVDRIRKQKYSLLKNRVFDLLEQKGYKFRLYHTAYFNICSDRPDEHIEYCLEDDSARIGVLSKTPIAVTTKLKLIIATWFSTVKMFKTNRSVFDHYTRIWLGSGVHDAIIDQFKGFTTVQTGPIGSMRLLDQLEKDIVRSPGGTVFFAHLLLPHFPYLYDSKCGVIKNPETWQNSLYFHVGKSVKGEKLYLEIYERYYDQVACIYTRFDRLFAVLQEKNILENAIVIIHGDHGSRNVVLAPTAARAHEENWPRYAADSFSTLFAIKAPGVEPGVTNVKKPLDILLKEFFLAPEELRKEKPEEAYVFLEGDEGRFVKAPFDLP